MGKDEHGLISNEEDRMFCISAHGHTNPMLPVVAELVRRGNTARGEFFGALCFCRALSIF